MTRRYPTTINGRIAFYRNKLGYSVQRTAELFGCSTSHVIRICEHYADT